MNKLKKYFERLISYVKTLIEMSNEDKVTVYAAQASFFVIISVVPFLSLVIAILSFFIPADIYSLIDKYAFSQDIKDVICTAIDELLASSKVSLLSVSAVMTLWSASKGSMAIRAGIKNVYGTENSDNFIIKQIKSLLYTIVLLVVIIANIVLVHFGNAIGEQFHIVKITDVIMYFGIPILIVVMSAAFTAMYASTVKPAKTVKDTITPHVPGAVVATIGWMAYSAFYALYIRYFSRAASIYGGLAAICLIMLWLYFCMIILLFGAEINKLIMKNKRGSQEI